MANYILYREISDSEDKTKNPEKWVFESDNKTLRFFIKKETLSELVESVVKENKGNIIPKPNLSTISQSKDFNERYKKIPASPEEISEFYRLYEEIISRNRE